MNQLKPLFSNRLSLKRLVKSGMYSLFITILFVQSYQTCGYTVGLQTRITWWRDCIAIALQTHRRFILDTVKDKSGCSTRNTKTKSAYSYFLRTAAINFLSSSSPYLSK